MCKREKAYFYWRWEVSAVVAWLTSSCLLRCTSARRAASASCRSSRSLLCCSFSAQHSTSHSRAHHITQQSTTQSLHHWIRVSINSINIAFSLAEATEQQQHIHTSIFFWFSAKISSKLLCSAISFFSFSLSAPSKASLHRQVRRNKDEWPISSY